MFSAVAYRHFFFFFCFTELKGLLLVFSKEIAVQHSVRKKGVAENIRKALTNIDVFLPCVQIVRA